MTTIDPRLRSELEAALALAPTAAGGAALVLATAGPPPALALLSTSSVRLAGDQAQIAVQSRSSVVRQLGGSCSVLVPSGARPLRVTVEAMSSHDAGAITLLSGTLTAIMPTIELPWRLELSFQPSEQPGGELFLAYWEQTRRWLEDGAHGPSPTPPQAQLAGSSRHGSHRDTRDGTSHGTRAKGAIHPEDA